MHYEAYSHLQEQIFRKPEMFDYEYNNYQESCNKSDFQNAMSPLKRNRSKNKRMVVPMPTSSSSSTSTSKKLPFHQDGSIRKRCQEKVKVRTQVDFQSILRIRPLTLEEKGDRSVFSTPKDDQTTIRLHSLKDRPTHTSISRRQKDIEVIPPTAYKFDAVLNEEQNQIQTYGQVAGMAMAQDAVRPLFNICFENLNRQNIEARQHVIISMGVSNSGKTYTIFGDNSQRDQEGVVPRLIDDMFTIEKELDMKRMSLGGKNHTQLKFGVQLSMVHVHNDHVYDMLSTITESGGSVASSSSQHSSNKIPLDRTLKKRKSNVSKMVASFETRTYHHHNQKPLEQMKELNIKQDRTTNDFNVNSTVVFCASSNEARDTLYKGLENCTTSATKMNKSSSRGHTMITLRPVIKSLLKRNNDRDTVLGGSINVIDMAGIERTKNSAVSGISMRESASINTTISAVLNCLRTIKENCSIDEIAADSMHTCENVENIEPTKNGSRKSTTKPHIVPYRQNKLTMLMQPLFSGNFDGRDYRVRHFKNTVKILVSVYPGSKDYNEKKTLLSEINSLRGLSTHRVMMRNLDHNDHSSKNELPNCYKTSSPMTYTSSSSSAVEDVGSAHSESSPDPKKFSSPLKMIAKAVKPHSTQKRKAEEINRLSERIKELESENETLVKNSKESKERICFLQDSNKKLRLELKESKVAVKKLTNEVQNLKKHDHQQTINRGDTKSSIQNFLLTRELRWREQNLLPSPLREHMKAVEGHRAVYSGNVMGMMMTKPPFQLVVPENSNETKFAETPEKGDEVGRKKGSSAYSDGSCSA